jgi:hypothetical protein
MLFELPHELPRRRQVADDRPLPPSPLELHREQLDQQRQHPVELNLPREQKSKEPTPEHARPDVRRALSDDHPVSRRTHRNHLPRQIIGPSLRPEEIKAIGEIGRFRVLATRDLATNVYGGRTAELARDLRFLEQHGLVQVDSVNARRDGRGGRVERIEVVTLTEQGRKTARWLTGLPQDQKLYSGLVKPREVEHDSQIYRAYLKEAERIEKQGGQRLRVRLDFEIKAQVQKAIYANRKAEPKRDINDIKRQVAQELELPYVNNGIQIPDARIEYDLDRKNDDGLDQGSRSGHSDIEVLTAAYRPGHLRAKAQAGFHVYASSSDRTTLLSRIEDDHHLLDNILEL